MAWIRTALSLLSFGFAIYKILQGFVESGQVLRTANTPQNVGLFMVGMGTLAILMGTIEYVQRFKELHLHQHFQLARAPFAMAVIMSITGVTLFFSIVEKLL